MVLRLADLSRRLDLELTGARSDDVVVDVLASGPDERRVHRDGQRVVVLNDGVDDADAAAADWAGSVVLRSHTMQATDRPCLRAHDTRSIDLLRAEVSAAFHADAAGEARLLTTSSQVLTRAALAGGVQGVVTQLASRTDAWAALLDPNGEVITSAAAAPLHLAEAKNAVFHRPVRIRHPHLAVFPVESAGSIRAYLVVAARGGQTGRVRELAQHASDLINLTLHTHDHSRLERLGRNTVVDWLASGQLRQADRVLAEWGIRGHDVQAFALSSRSRSVDLESLMTRWLDELGAAHLVSSSGTPFVGLLDPDVVDAFESRVREVVAESGLPLCCGIGRREATERIPEAIAQARNAHSVALATSTPTIRYDDMATSHLLELTLSSVTRRDLADVLRPLDFSGQEGIDVRAALHAYLAENANVARTAARLGIHRHTVRNRIARAEELCGLALDNADDRAVAWLAIKARL